MGFLAHGGLAPEPLLCAKTQLAMLTPHLRTTQYSRRAAPAPERILAPADHQAIGTFAHSEFSARPAVSPQKYTTVEAVGEQIKTMVENGKVCGAHITGATTPSQRWATWRRRTGPPIAGEMVSPHARGAQQGTSSLM
ncbi:hypothetical protein VTO73DRAFT_13972 [Trametes versicolor]